MNYWQKRNLKAQRALENKSIKEIDEQLAKYYKSTMEQSIKDFESVYDKLLLTIEEGREPTPADLYKLDKYWQAQAQLQNELQKMGDKSMALLQKQFVKKYQQFYNNLKLPADEHFGKVSTEMAQQMINRIWTDDGKSWSKRIWENTAKLQQTLNDGLIDCVVTGKKTTELKQILMKRFNVSYYRANSLVRTELAHINTMATKQRYEDYGIKKYEIWADKDERRCKVCGKLHQTVYEIHELPKVPAHPNCRCSIIPVIE